jgi:hypothetical protein
MSGAAWLRRIALGLLLSVVVLAALTARVITQGESELSQSDAAFDRGDLADSIAHARRAAVMYAPGAPHVSAAYERLRAIAVGSEAQGDPEMARKAWDATRAAALETRHVTTPRSRDLDLANANLARLAMGPGGAGDRARAASVLTRDDTPRAPWVAVLGAGFGLFAAGLLLASRRGVTEMGRISVRPLVVASLIALAGVACWTLAVLRA